MLKLKIIATLLLLGGVVSAQAKDLSAQQAGYNNALQKMEKAEAEYKADAQVVTETELFIEKKKKQLVDEKKKAELSRKNYEDAKEKLDQSQTALDKAWKD